MSSATSVYRLYQSKSNIFAKLLIDVYVDFTSSFIKNCEKYENIEFKFLSIEDFLNFVFFIMDKENTKIIQSNKYFQDYEGSFFDKLAKEDRKEMNKLCWETKLAFMNFLENPFFTTFVEEAGEYVYSDFVQSFLYNSFDFLNRLSNGMPKNIRKEKEKKYSDLINWIKNNNIGAMKSQKYVNYYIEECLKILKENEHLNSLLSKTRPLKYNDYIEGSAYKYYLHNLNNLSDSPLNPLMGFPRIGSKPYIIFEDNNYSNFTDEDTKIEPVSTMSMRNKHES